MTDRNRGATMIEMTITILVGGALLAFVSQILPRTLRANRVNGQATDVSQNAEVVSALLMLDVKNAGYRGGTAESFDICDTCSPSGDRVANFLDIVKWPFTIDAATATSAGLRGIDDLSDTTDDPLPILTHVPGLGSAPDTLGFVRVLKIDNAPSDAANIYDLEFVLYTVDTADRELVRLRQDLSCDGIFAAPGGASGCRLNGGNNGRQPAVLGIEDIQFFFKLRNEVGGEPIYSATLPNNPSSVASVGVYTRARSTISDPNYTDVNSYPATHLLPNGRLVEGTTISNWGELGVPTTDPFNDTFRRIEKVQEIALRTTPACNLLPIGWPEDAIGLPGTSTSAGFFGAGPDQVKPGPGQFGWLSWDGSNNVPSLVQNIIYPNLASSTYRDPTDPIDTALNVGDIVEGLSSSQQPTVSALAAYRGIPIVVPLWASTPTINGSNPYYRISGFANIVLDSSLTIASLTGTYLGEASVTCAL